MKAGGENLLAEAGYIDIKMVVCNTGRLKQQDAKVLQKREVPALFVIGTGREGKGCCSPSKKPKLSNSPVSNRMVVEGASVSQSLNDKLFSHGFTSHIPIFEKGHDPAVGNHF